MNNKRLKVTSRLIVLAISVTQIFSFNTLVFANEDYDYSNPIYSEGVDDTFVYDSNDSVVITKKNVKRNLPKVTGLYDISQYPIPLTNKVPDKDTFDLIKSENKEIMNRVEEDIKNGTLTKHKAADGQFYGSVPDSALGVEKKVYINTNVKGTHSLASYVPAGEIATVKLNDEALNYAKKGKIKVSVGMTMVDAVDYNHNKNDENRMPYLGKTFSISQNETKVGTPFGGMVYLEIDDSVPSGLNFEVEVKGVVDTPYYDLGKTTYEEWQTSKNAPGLFAEVRTPYLRFLIPAKFIRNIDDPHKAALFWTNVASLSSNIMAQQHRIKPMTLTFDQYITAGVAYASVGSWTCNLPPSWGTSALNYDGLMSSGSWGIIHEINHHYQGRHGGYSDEWGIGPEFSEITNNALSAISYILYTNIAAHRGEEGTQDWNKVADPYSSLKQQIFESKDHYKKDPNIGNFMYSTFAHEIGPKNLINVIKSTYDGGTFNGEYIPPYDYKLESDKKKPRADRYDDLAYRLCVASGRDYTWYIQKELLWPIKPETINKIKSHGYEEVIPVQSVYGMGEVGRETGRPFYVPSTGYVFDFEKSLVSPGKVSIVDISNPKYGTLTKRPDGKYDYRLSSSIPKNTPDEFILTVRVEAGGISHETKLNCKIGIDYNSSNVEKFNITKWDIHEALEDLKTKQPYATSSSIGMKIYSDDGNNLARSKGYFVLEESGEYEFQVFGDDRAVFELHSEDGTTLQSLTEDYSANADQAYNLPKSTKFTVNLEANKPYSYTLITNNNGGLGWADVNIRKTSGDTSWKSINQVYSNLDDVGKSTDRSFTMPEPEYVRPPILASGNETVVKDITVISTPQGVDPNNPDSAKEADPNNIVDGDINTYFHSSYNNDKTPFPHEYIFDLGGEKSFNNLEIYTRRTGEVVGVIGDYEIYVADEYDGDSTNWTKIAEDHTRQGNSNASQDLKISVPQTSAKYLKIKALNNRNNRDLTILAEVKLSTTTNVKNVIAQNSSFIQYDGKWTKDSNGAFVNGATYNTTDGYFMYCFEGSESNIYVTKDVEVEMRINGGKWQRKKLIGSLREPSLTLDMTKEGKSSTSGKHVIEVRAIGQELALNMVSTDGTFYKGKAPDKSKPPVIEGATDVEIGVGKVAAFDMKDGVTVRDDYDTLTIDDVTISGKIEEPKPGNNKVSELTYTVQDGDKNVTTVKRQITVTNQLPEISGLDEVYIKKGTKFNLREGVIATDYEDKDITNNIVISGISKKGVPYEETDSLDEGQYEVEYSVTDSDKNTTTKIRTLNVRRSKAPVIDGAKNVEIGIGKVNTFDMKDGITVSDDEDTLTLDNVTISGTIEKPAPGKNKVSELTYTVQDSDGNVTTVKRKITVTNQMPEISGTDEVTIKKGTKFDLKEKVVATDYEDKDITDKIVISRISKQVPIYKNIINERVEYEETHLLEEGKYEVEYSVTDSDKNTTTKIRKLNVANSKPPVISGVTNVEIGIGQVNTFDKMHGITVSDDDDNLTINDVKVSGTIEKPAPGKNKVSELTYTVQDSNGNVTTTKREITVTNQLPEISGIDEVTIKKGTKFDLKEKVVATDYEDKDITNKIVISRISKQGLPDKNIINNHAQDEETNQLDIGTYEVEYSVTDSDQNTTKAIRILKVTNAKAPIINGATNVKIGIGQIDAFDKMAGVSYIDDNDMTGLVITVSGSLGKPSPGTNEDYNLTYSVTDNDGNTTNVNRVITVTNQIPEIKGLSDITIDEGTGKDFDFAKGVSASDLEDGNLTDSIQLPTIDLSKLAEGVYFAEYIVTDSDGNVTISKRTINVLANKVNDDIESDKNGDIESSEDNGSESDKNGDIEPSKDNGSESDKNDQSTEQVENVQTGDTSIIKYFVIIAITLSILIVRIRLNN